jgi:hypothetical protein
MGTKEFNNEPNHTAWKTIGISCRGESAPPEILVENARTIAIVLQMGWWGGQSFRLRDGSRPPLALRYTTARAE